ncbi:MAG: hypothetical protein EZS28_023215 [Streblomastix strix]|uniref:Uncharacterized protein n=1 Tax=Streblomastix strix TaxID=222440 RepID=A0A5J4VF72_9EUKA|nr:MAG: hypothetical protein EZS28_023215 [Streblomastix strix]
MVAFALVAVICHFVLATVAPPLPNSFQTIAFVGKGDEFLEGFLEVSWEQNAGLFIQDCKENEGVIIVFFNFTSNEGKCIKCGRDVVPFFPKFKKDYLQDERTHVDEVVVYERTKIIHWKTAEDDTEIWTYYDYPRNPVMLKWHGLVIKFDGVIEQLSPHDEEYFHPPSDCISRCPLLRGPGIQFGVSPLGTEYIASKCMSSVSNQSEDTIVKINNNETVVNEQSEIGSTHYQISDDVKFQDQSTYDPFETGDVKQQIRGMQADNNNNVDSKKIEKNSKLGNNMENLPLKILDDIQESSIAQNWPVNSTFSERANNKKKTKDKKKGSNKSGRNQITNSEVDHGWPYLLCTKPDSLSGMQHFPHQLTSALSQEEQQLTNQSPQHLQLSQSQSLLRALLPAPTFVLPLIVSEMRRSSAIRKSRAAMGFDIGDNLVNILRENEKLKLEKKKKSNIKQRL